VVSSVIEYDPNAERNSATGKVRNELERFGISLDDKTIRNLMEEGMKLSDSDK
jgi:hypothetical protein